MSRTVRIIISALLVAVTIISMSVFNVSAADTIELPLSVTYGQTEAREMLALINDFRTDTEGGAWYWNADDTTKTVFNTDGNPSLEPFVYDYELEKAAMLRAAEIALSFSHTRPNGGSCFTAFPSGYIPSGENIAAGQSTAESAFVSWQENEDPYADQGHRRNMLDTDYNAIGIGHVVMNGVHYWVQVLGTTDSPVTTATTANDSNAKVSVDALTDDLTFVDASLDSESCSIQVGSSETAPALTVAYTHSDHWPSGNILTYPEAVWTSSDDTVAAVSDGKINALKIGTATLTATDGTHSAELAVTVTPVSLTGAAVTLEYTLIEYTGSEMKPAVTSVTLDGKTLTEGTDYTVAYSENKAVGTAAVTITGTGNYKDTAQASFTIKECSHVLDSGTQTKAPTCTEDGVKTYACTKCDYTKTEAITAPGHTPGAAATCDAPQLCTVCDATIADATGNHVDSNDDDVCDTCSKAMPTTTTSTTATTTSTTKKTTAPTEEDEKNELFPETGDSTSSAATITALLIFSTSTMVIFFIFLNEKLRVKIRAKERMHFYGRRYF